MGVGNEQPGIVHTAMASISAARALNLYLVADSVAQRAKAISDLTTLPVSKVTKTASAFLLLMVRQANLADFTKHHCCHPLFFSSW